MQLRYQMVGIISRQTVKIEAELTRFDDSFPYLPKGRKKRKAFSGFMESDSTESWIRTSDLRISTTLLTLLIVVVLLIPFLRDFTPSKIKIKAVLSQLTALY